MCFLVQTLQGKTAMRENTTKLLDYTGLAENVAQALEPMVGFVISEDAAAEMTAGLVTKAAAIYEDKFSDVEVATYLKWAQGRPNGEKWDEVGSLIEDMVRTQLQSRIQALALADDGEDDSEEE